MKKTILLLIIIILFLAGGWFWWLKMTQNSIPKATDYSEQSNRSETTAANNQPASGQILEVIDNQKKNILLPSFDIKVPFVSQAPFANWDPLHNEACEEASMIMAAKYFKKENLDKEIMEDEIQRLIKWETENGFPIDLTAEQVVEILGKYFEVKAEISKEVTIDKIKATVASGKLVILPLAGRLVPNPYYRQPGPLYHMLVVRGFDKDEFITNDPGTKRGEGYRYKYNDLLLAVHNWTGGVREYKDPRPEPDMLKGEKVMIIVSRDNDLIEF